MTGSTYFDTDLTCTVETVQHPWSDHKGVLLTIKREIDTRDLDDTPGKLTEAALHYEKVVEKAREAFNYHLTYEVIEEGDGRKWRHYSDPGDFIFHKTQNKLKQLIIIVCVRVVTL